MIWRSDLSMITCCVMASLDFIKDLFHALTDTIIIDTIILDSIIIASY